ncbi:hypothetical protein ACVLD2_003303 [Paenibacillus sp. PvR052]|nr:hypothetical protein [Paenibacillus sp. PvP091]MBP1170911.1 hypothetical protein [Paenibacillus sp. PvR098]MBP2441939.1 hypothetical protein [Paenibacillus sp. PvP052]
MEISGQRMLRQQMLVFFRTIIAKKHQYHNWFQSRL